MREFCKPRFSLWTLFVLCVFASICSRLVSLHLSSLEKEAALLAALDSQGLKAEHTDRRLGWLYKQYSDELAKQAIVLQLADSQVTDEDLLAIAEIESLRGLYLSRTAITEKGLSYLGDMPHLIELVARRNAIAKCPDLKHMPLLQRLDLGFTGVSQINANGGHPLVRLQLRGTAIGDDTLRTLPSFPQLELLDIAGTPGEPNAITDAGISTLSPDKFPALKTLFLCDTATTARGVAELRTRFTGIKVYR